MNKLKLLLILPILFFYGCEAPRVISIREKAVSPITTINADTITIKNGQFSPQSISIAKGSELSIINYDNKIYTIISNPHPSHSELRDFYKILHKKESYQYKINNAGSFGVHVEENPSIQLQITVLN